MLPRLISTALRIAPLIRFEKNDFNVFNWLLYSYNNLWKKL